MGIRVEVSAVEAALTSDEAEKRIIVLILLQNKLYEMKRKQLLGFYYNSSTRVQIKNNNININNKVCII